VVLHAKLKLVQTDEETSDGKDVVVQKVDQISPAKLFVEQISLAKPLVKSQPVTDEIFIV